MLIVACPCVLTHKSARSRFGHPKDARRGRPKDGAHQKILRYLRINLGSWVRGYFALGNRVIILLIQVVFSEKEIFNTTEYIFPYYLFL